MNEPILLDKYPAEIVSFVAQRTLAKISAMNIQGLLSIGWYLKDDNGRIYINPAIDKLYELSNAGVWIARTDPNGYNIADGLIYGEAQKQTYNTFLPSIGTPTSPATLLSARRRIQVIPFISNAGGTLDADLDLSGAVGAVPGYYMVIDEIFFLSLDYGGASTPTMVFSTTSHNAFRTHGPLTVAGDNQVNKQLESVPIYYLNDDDEVVFLDTTTSDLGNAKNWLAIVKFHFET